MSLKKLPLEMHENINHGIQIFYHKGESINHVVHGHNFYEIFCVTDGSALHWCNNISQKINKGSLVFIRPTDYHQYVDSTEDFSFYNLVFSVETANKIFSLYDKEIVASKLLNTLNPPNITLTSDQRENIISKFHNDIKTLNIKIRSLYNVELLCSLLPLFVNSSIYKVEIQPNWFQELLEYMERDTNYLKGVNFLYNIATRSREHVSRCFKKYLNITPTEYINSKKLIYASNLLKQTNIEIIEICDMAGFTNLSHFYHLFKIEFNITPRKYRAENANRYLL